MRSLSPQPVGGGGACPADTRSLSASRQEKVPELGSSLVGIQAGSAVPASQLAPETPPEFQGSSERGQDGQRLRRKELALWLARPRE